MRILRAKSTEELGYLDSKNVPEPHVRQARPPYKAWEGWGIPDGGWEALWAVVTCCKILLNLQKQRVLMGRKITPDTLIKTLSGAALLYAISFIPRPMKCPAWCQARAELALAWHRSDAPTVQTWVDAHLPSGSFLAFPSPSLRLHKCRNFNSISVTVLAGLRVLPRGMLEAVSYREQLGSPGASCSWFLDFQVPVFVSSWACFQASYFVHLLSWACPRARTTCRALGLLCWLIKGIMWPGWKALGWCFWVAESIQKRKGVGWVFPMRLMCWVLGSS